MSSSYAWLEEQKEALTRGFERVRDEVIEGFEKELKKRDEEYQKELKKKDEKQQILSGRYNEEIIKNAYLIEENSRLKRHLGKVDSRRSAPPAHAADPGHAPLAALPSAKETDATVSCEEYRQLTEQFNELQKKHMETVQRLRYIERKNVAVMQKNKEMKESVYAWQKFSERHQAKKEKAKSEEKPITDLSKALVSVEEVPPPMPSSPRSSVIRTPRSLVGFDRSSPAAISLLSHVDFPPPDEVTVSNAHQLPHDDLPRDGVAASFRDDEEMLDQPEQAVKYHDHADGLKEREMVGVTDEEYRSNDKLHSSQTTEDEAVTQSAERAMTHMVRHGEDDMPEFVSERSLKRKRAAPTNIDVYVDRLRSDGTPANPFRIKEEPRSSPPPKISPSKLLRKETLDLDELGPAVVSTPHHRLRRNYAAVVGTLRHQRSTSVPLIKEEAVDEGGYHVENVNLASQRRPSNHDAVVGEARAYSEPFDPTLKRPAPLRPLDPNARNAVEHVEEHPHKRPRKDDLRTKFRMLAESGEDAPPTDENDQRLAPELARANFNRKLKAKDAQTPTKSTASKTKTPTTATSRLSVAQVPTPPSSTTRATYTPLSRLNSRKGTSIESRSAAQPTATPSSRPVWPETRRVAAAKPQAQAPLRSKPANELKVSDFKANPKYNQGYSYAFAETVRKRADRACLPGCTRPDCCGSTFRTLAAAAPPLSPSQEEKLLEEYLGDTYDTMRLTQMSPEQRHELVLQARTREIANKHGKHRQAYERHKTPPGFWRYDFPSTQEQEEDRLKAAEMEKEMVQERRAEALRKGGRWIFRDE